MFNWSTVISHCYLHRLLFLTYKHTVQPLFPGESGVDQLVEIIKVITSISSHVFQNVLAFDA